MSTSSAPLLGTLNQDLRGHFSDATKGPSQSTPSKSSSMNTAWPKGTRVKVKPYRKGTFIIERHPRWTDCDLDIVNVMAGVPEACVDLDPDLCPHCAGHGGHFTGDPQHHTEGWSPCLYCSDHMTLCS